jgi:hypothetical protein
MYLHGQQKSNVLWKLCVQMIFNALHVVHVLAVVFSNEWHARLEERKDIYDGTTFSVWLKSRNGPVLEDMCSCH